MFEDKNVLNPSFKSAVAPDSTDELRDVECVVAMVNHD